MGLVSWLKRVEGSEEVSVALGNESGDLDSVASALCYAFLLKEQLPIVPILNFPYTALAIRKELLFLLQKIGLDPQNLSFKENFPEHPKSIFLIDHHRLALDQEKYTSLVVSILDHHPGEVPSYPSLQTCNIATCGSTATLVYEEARGKIWPADCALLMASAILIDTQGLQDPEKTTVRDRKALERLSPLAGIDDPMRLYQELYSLKISLTPEEALIKDLKHYRSGALYFAIASLPEEVNISDSLAENLLHELKLSVLFLFQPFKNEKRLTLYSSDSHLAQRIGLSLPFPAVEIKESGSLFSLPINLSRKQLVPKLDLTFKIIQGLIE